MSSQLFLLYLYCKEFKRITKTFTMHSAINKSIDGYELEKEIISAIIAESDSNRHDPLHIYDENDFNTGYVGTIDQPGFEYSIIRFYNIKRWTPKLKDYFESVLDKVSRKIGVRLEVLGFTNEEVEFDDTRCYPATAEFIIKPSK